MNALTLLFPLLLGGCFPIGPPDGDPAPVTQVVPPGGKESDCAALAGDASCAEHRGCAVFECATCGGKTAHCGPASATPTDVCGPVPYCPREMDCETIPSDVSALAAANRACDTDADCALVPTGCGLSGECGVSMNAAAADSLTYELDVWKASCTTGCVPASCDAPQPPRCVAGACE